MKGQIHRALLRQIQSTRHEDKHRKVVSLLILLLVTVIVLEKTLGMVVHIIFSVSDWTKRALALTPSAVNFQTLLRLTTSTFNHNATMSLQIDNPPVSEEVLSDNSMDTLDTAARRRIQNRLNQRASSEWHFLVFATTQPLSSQNVHTNCPRRKEESPRV